MNWKEGGEAYLPSLAMTEIDYGIPTDLLARIAFQESSWRSGVVYSQIRSRENCVGLMQLNPLYYPNAGRDWRADIDEAGITMSEYHHRFQDWQVAVAAYNDGPGNIDLWLRGQRALPIETSNYVGAVIADVPVAGCIVPIVEAIPTVFPAA